MEHPVGLHKVDWGNLGHSYYISATALAINEL